MEVEMAQEQQEQQDQQAAAAEAEDEEQRIVKLVKSALQSRRQAPPCSRPIPVLLTAGKPLSLPALFTSVTAHFGGYSHTTAASAWPHVATHLALPTHLAPSLKLIYLKYLRCLERSTTLANQGKVQGELHVQLGEVQVQVQVQRKRVRSEWEPKECLVWIRSLALDPGDQVKSAKSERLLPIIRSIRSRLQKDSRPETTSSKARRPTRYSLRQFTATGGATTAAEVEQPGKPVLVGRDFQVEVPPLQRTEKPDEEAEVFMGKVVWARRSEEQAEEDEEVMERRRGRGKCSCPEKRSIECVRLHVETEQKLLKLLLGETFAEWGFDRMGERVAKSWSVEEQAKFRRVFVRQQASPDVWSELRSAFPGRSRRELVSFYFNVFMLRRRAVQNRIGNKPDSDDDSDDLPDTPAPVPAAVTYTGGTPSPSVGFHKVHLVECIQIE